MNKKIEKYISQAEDFSNEVQVKRWQERVTVFLHNSHLIKESENFVKLQLESNRWDVLSRQLGFLEALCDRLKPIKTTGKNSKFEKIIADWAQEIQKINSTNELENFIQTRFLSELRRKKTLFVTNFNNLNFSTIQKFKLKYILAKFSHFLEKERANGEDASLDEYFKKNIHIEHILSENHEAKVLKESFSGNKKEYDLYKEKIGNLTLLEEPINTSIQDNPYSLKKIEYKKSKFYLTRSIVQLENVGNNTSINRLNAVLKSFGIWDKKSIEDRQGMLLELAMKIWQAE